WLMMSLWDALRMNMMISYQELVRTFLRVVFTQQEILWTFLRYFRRMGPWWKQAWYVSLSC
ncbi:hypothetical protein EIA08_23365, partial [Escherichia coli]